MTAPFSLRVRREGVLDVAQAVLAEEDLPADEKGRRAECAPADRGLGVGDEPSLHVGGLGRFEDGRTVEARGVERCLEHGRIVHLLRLLPHVMEAGLDVRAELALLLHGDRAAHEQQRVDGEEGVHLEAVELVPRDEAGDLQPFVCQLVLDAGEGLEGRAVVRGLEDAAEENRDVADAGARPRHDAGQDLVGEIGVGTAEIEVELDDLGAAQGHGFVLRHGLHHHVSR